MPDPEAITQPASPRPTKRRAYRRWIALLVILGGLVWLNGPGFRMLAPRVVIHYLEKAGIRGNFTIDGRLIDGFSFSNLRIEGDKELASLTIDRVIPTYQWRGLIKGRLEGLTIEGIHAELRLGLEKDEDEEKPPLDLQKLAETLRSVRGRVIPVDLEIKDLTLAATRDGEPAFRLNSSRIFHQPGSAEITLELGAIQNAAGTEWPAQTANLRWNPEDISIERIDPFPGISLREFVLRLPARIEPSLETELHLDDSVFMITSTPGFSSAGIDLREGQVRIAEAAKRFGVEIPATATLTSLAVELNNILPDPKAATGDVRVLLEDVAWQDWSASELSLDAELLADRATIASRGLALGTEISLQAAAPVTRSGTQFLLGDAAGTFNIASVPALVASLAARIEAIDSLAAVPPSTVGGDFNLSFVENRPDVANAGLVVEPVDGQTASPIALKGRWQVDQPVVGELVLDGLTATATYQIEPAIYQATLTLDKFTSSRIDPWLAIFKVAPGGVADLTGNWSGNGDIKAGQHRGELSLASASWARMDAPVINAVGDIDYDWPGGFQTEGLSLRMDEQAITLDAALADGQLELSRFLWSDGGDEIAEGSAKLPVPEDFAKWREMLANDTRPVEVSINSRVLSLGLLKPWLPAAEQLDPRSTGQVQLRISGNYAAPVVDAAFEARELRSPARPGLPPADLKVTLKADEGRIALDATATAPDFPAGVVRATMPFRPAEWAANPALLMDEPLDARMDLPRLDLSRFTTLVPGAQQLSGLLTGNVVAAGKIGKPDLKGELRLTSGGFRSKDARLPAVENLTADIDLTLDQVTLRRLRTTVAGGSMTGGGSLSLAGGKPGNLDFNLRGDNLPLMRNDTLIVRANMNFRIQGPWETATLSGTVGVVDSVFFRDIELLPIGRPFNTPEAAALPRIDPPQTQNATAAIPEPFRNWNLDVTVRTQDPFLIRGNLATGEVTGSVRVGGTIGNPLPDGVVVISDFRASLPFSTLLVRSGTLTFTPAGGFDPMLEIRGTAEPRPYRVTVYAYGRMSDPQLVLTSNPPLPDNEIMTLLATGTTTSGLEDPQAASARAMQLLIEELRRGRFLFGKQLRPLLGLLDRVDFSLSEADPYSSESYSTATIALSNRWYITAGMGSEGDTRALAIWRISFR